MGERTYGSFEDADGAHGYSREDIEGMSRQEKVRMMIAWFHAHFEDPAHRTPYESAEGGYQWIWGGPHDADEEIQDQFSDVVDLETMQEAVQEVQSDGLFDWAPRERPGDYEDQDDEGVLAGEIVDGDAEWPPLVAVAEPPTTEPEARQEVVRRLGELEALIRPLVAQHGMMGHNQPPEPMEVEQPCSREEWLALSEAVQALQQQTETAEPNDVQIASASLTLSKVGRKLAGWLQVRVEKGIDAAMVACGTAAGAMVVVDMPKIVDGIGQVIHAVSRWLEALPMPF